ncbi:MAG: 6-bladed beta-propeller [Candidatus Aminicenantes bacterium]|nr:6-bladed beta-propeller [Candidatus Aminicenantes bacterium]
MRKSGFCKTAIILNIFCLLMCCSPKKEEVKAKLFSLEKILSIDTENNNIADMGLTDIGHFDIDSEGNIFIANLRAEEHFIFILNKNGALVSKFGGKGQGPGEFFYPMELVVSKQDEIFITDKGKVAVFSNSGEFIKEFRIGNGYQKIIPLDKDRTLVIAVKLNEDLSQSFQVILCSSELEELKILDSSKIESFKKSAKVNIIPTLVYWEASDNHIYTGNTDDYEIRVFDFDGRLLRNIKKEYEAVLLSDKKRKEYLESLQKYPSKIKERFFIPDVFPPFKDIVSWDDEWLFIQTYDEPLEGSFRYDIFDTSGKLIGKTVLEGYQVKLKGGRIFSLKEKESGYKELVVYRISWDPPK